MKSRAVLAVILICLITELGAGSYVQVTSGAASPGFMLTLEGHAHDESLQQYAITITLTGNRDGRMKLVVSLRVKGGNVNVEDFGTWAVTSGYGALVQKCHRIWMSIKITEKYYGGRPAVWHLCGRTGTESDNSLPVSFLAHKIILPLKGSPKLYHLDLEGTLTLN